jgi:hypothetical protein
MPINSTEEFEKAMQEFQRLSTAKDDTPEGRRRAELDADIKAYNAERGGNSGDQLGGGSGMPGRY